MKKTLLSVLAALALTASFTGDLFAQLPRNPRSVLPANFKTDKLIEYNRLPDKEVDFDEFYQVEENIFYHDDAIRLNPSLGYPTIIAPRPTVCGNGDFESGLSTVEWRGGYGHVSTTGQVLYAGFANGIVPGLLGDSSAHHTIVTTGTDPYVGISMVAPTGSTRAVRIGNAKQYRGAELLSKTFTVPADNQIITFWYALVLQSPMDHDSTKRPGFRVRVLDASSGVEIPGTIALGSNGSDSVWADTDNSYFKVAQNGSIVYKDWMCAQIDLRKYVGRKVTVQFVTKDCAQGQHWGYAYIDDFCGTCKQNPFNIGIGKVDCNKNSVCVDYVLPQQGGVTGTVNITLSIYQNGVLVGSIPSGVLNTGTSYCFTVNSTTVPGLNLALGGYDFVASGAFAINGSSLGNIFTLSPPDGMVSGQNNDCQITQIQPCCPGTNVVKNGNFEAGITGITSGYSYQGTVASGSVLPGRYGILTDAQALTVSPTWNTNCAASGRHMVVNGFTGLSTSRIVWRQVVTVTPGKTYKFCGDFKNLPQCGFDVLPKVTVQIANAPGQSVLLSSSQTQTINASSAACAWVNLQQSVNVPFGLSSVQITITLDETGAGDGNDLALDNLSFIELLPVSSGLTNFNRAVSNVTATTYNMTLSAVSPLASGCSHYWEVAEVDATLTAIPSTHVINPAVWSGLATNTLNGYVGTSSLSGSAPGIFYNDKTYLFVYGRSCSCEGLSRRYDIYGPAPAFRGVPNGGSNGPQLLGSGVLDDEKAAAFGLTGGISAKQSIRVYPNPTGNNVTVQKAASDQDVTVNVFNAYGQVVRKVAAKGSETKVDVPLAEFAPGTYLLQVVTEKDGIIHSEKITRL